MSEQVLKWLRDDAANDLQFVPGREAHGKAMLIACDDAITTLQSRLGAALGRLGLQQDENGASYDEIDRLQLALELREQDIKSLSSRLHQVLEQASCAVLVSSETLLKICGGEGAPVCVDIRHGLRDICPTCGAKAIPVEKPLSIGEPK